MRRLRIYLFALTALFTAAIFTAIISFRNAQIAMHLELQHAAADPDLPQPEDCGGPSILGLLISVGWPTAFLFWTILTLALQKTIYHDTAKGFAIVITILGALPIMILWTLVALR